MKVFPELLLEACPLMYPKSVFAHLKPFNLSFFNIVHYRIHPQKKKETAVTVLHKSFHVLSF